MKLSPSDRFVALIRSHLKSMEYKDARVAYLARLLWGSEYGWGKEMLGSTDCSGSVCWALWLLGYKIRTTAHVLWQNLSKEIEGMPWPGCLAFFWDKEGKRVKHVAIFSDRMLLMNAWNRFCDMPVNVQMQAAGNTKCVFSRLNWQELRAASNGLAYIQGIDKGLWPLFAMFDVESHPKVRGLEIEV